jgi:hypothetical protein
VGATGTLGRLFLMFSATVTSIFNFLESDFDFELKTLNDRAVQYERGDSFIRLSHSRLDEVSLQVGTLSLGVEKSFSAGILIALTSPAEGFALRDRIVSKQEHIEQALTELAQVLRTHGQRVLNGDNTVYADMQRVVEAYWVTRNDAQLRQSAEKAFASRDFSEALKQYRLLGERRTPLDSKRMEICEHNT